MSSPSPGKGRTPASICSSIVATAYTSVAGDSASPRACSGAMYAGVPMTSPRRVSTVPGLPETLAMPKSVTLRTPLAAKSMFSGLMSRCRTPRRCAADRPLRHARVAATACEAVMPPALVTLLRSVPRAGAP